VAIRGNWGHHAQKESGGPTGGTLGCAPRPRPGKAGGPTLFQGPTTKRKDWAVGGFFGQAREAIGQNPGLVGGFVQNQGPKRRCLAQSSLDQMGPFAQKRIQNSRGGIPGTAPGPAVITCKLGICFWHGLQAWSAPGSACPGFREQVGKGGRFQVVQVRSLVIAPAVGEGVRASNQQGTRLAKFHSGFGQQPNNQGQTLCPTRGGTRNCSPGQPISLVRVFAGFKKYAGARGLV